jgi:hypothetical protein
MTTPNITAMLAALQGPALQGTVPASVASPPAESLALPGSFSLLSSDTTGTSVGGGRVCNCT